MTVILPVESVIDEIPIHNTGKIYHGHTNCQNHTQLTGV
jgi:hypothetical protein